MLISLIAAGTVVWGVVTYNRLASLRVSAEGAWADISVQLKRRYDLIPNLVETVKGYASHEQKVFQQVTEARSRALSAIGPKDKEAAETQLAGTLKTLFAVAESYPQLRANENFLGLQQSLTQIEETLQGARRYYNAVVRDYNTALTVLPSNVVAQVGGFKAREFFQLDSAAEAASPTVSFS